MAKIENHTERLITLPNIDPALPPITLAPGLNNVPNQYLEAVDKLASEGKPGRKQAIEALQQPVMLWLRAGPRRGPQITVYADDQVTRDDGGNFPHDLNGKAKQVAVGFIRAAVAEGRRQVLEQWLDAAGRTMDKDVKTELQDAIATLKAKK